MGNFSRRDFIKFATSLGLVATEHPISKNDQIKTPEINTKATWSDGLRQLQNLARTEMNGIEYAQNFIINGDFQGWTPIERGRIGGVNPNLDYEIDRINREQKINPLPGDTLAEIVTIHTHPKNEDGARSMPPSLFYGDINGLCYFEFKPESKNIQFTGMVLDTFGVWEFKIDKNHPFIQTIAREAEKRISMGKYSIDAGVAVAEKYPSQRGELISNLEEEILKFQRKSVAPGRVMAEDIDMMIQAYRKAGVILKFTKYEELPDNLEPGKLTPKEK